ncbi:cellulose synthase-like protein D3 [Dendrobium catenatum]|uniref:cellulose synthase-like protein D3 n=1 Tax=Dendrobium catenatum TaxID=906689 RepID=UPI00109F45E6|nr:cellulose synthase-like protein D3 [Dendrobium catenatum]
MYMRRRIGSCPPEVETTKRRIRKDATVASVRMFSGKKQRAPPPRMPFGEVENDVSSVDFRNYRVQFPMTPDNGPLSVSMEPIHPLVSSKIEEHYVSSSLFTGGFNSVTRAHLMDKRTDSDTAAADGAAKSSTCSVEGCDGKLMYDERGEELLPCECEYKICRECFDDAVKNGGSMCPGCKEPYKATDLAEVARIAREKKGIAVRRLPAPPPKDEATTDRRLSVIRSAKSSDFDHNRWLFETKGTYGYGNAIWPEEAVVSDESSGGGGGGDEGGSERAPAKELWNKAWRPLTRKLRIPAAILSPYRLLILVRMGVLGLFLTWRITHKNHDAIWLWGMSVVCEIWFAFSWLLDQLPKLSPVNRVTDLKVLKEKFETPSPTNPTGKSDLPGLDVFVSTADPEKEPPLVTANTILSILAADYPIEKLACYLSDDGGALLTFEAMAEAASFAAVWVPFCRKHAIEPRNPESYFGLKRDPYKNKVRADFVRDRRRIKREYDEFKVRINALPEAIRRRSDAFHAREELKAARLQRQEATAAAVAGDEALLEPIKIPKATWMADGTHWPGTWIHSASDHSRGDHAGIIQVMLKPPAEEPIFGTSADDTSSNTEDDGGGGPITTVLDLSEVDIRLPMLVYMSREKRPGYDHNKKAGAMNALVRASAVLSNGPFMLNLDCDHYIYNSQALREGMCFMMDRGGDRICYVQFPQRFEGIDPSDRYANHNTVFFDVNMRALDGLQGPVYVGTGCLFRRIALYGFDPPRATLGSARGCCSCCFPRRHGVSHREHDVETHALRMEDDDGMNLYSFPRKFGNSSYLIDSIAVAEFQGRPLADHPSVKNGRPPGALIMPREPLDASAVAEAVSVVSCWYEDKTEWGTRVGWIYGSVTEDVVTGYRMHNRGWRSIYCVTKRDAFRGTAPINLTDRLHQVLRWATGSVEIFFSRNNALFAGPKLKFLQRMAYLNVGIYPFTSIFLIVYCFLPALSLFSGQFIVQTLNVSFLAYLLIITCTLVLLAVLEIKWSGIQLEEWWRNEQFWLIGGTSAHLAAVIQGLLKVIAGIEISFTLTSKSAGDDEDDDFADLYIVKWTSLMIPPLTIIFVNLIAIAVGVSRTIYATIPQWSKLLGGVFFSFWVLAHMYPFVKGLMGRRRRTPTIIYVWAGLLAITISLLWIAINPPSSASSQIGGSFSFP